MADCTQPDSCSDQILQFVSNLSPQENMLVLLKKRLYGGKWDPMLSDLHSRLDGKPYVFRLAGRIQEDIDRIHRLKSFENTTGIDLADYVIEAN